MNRLSPVDVYTKNKYEEKYRVYLRQYSINQWKPSVNSFEEFVEKVSTNK